MSDPARRALRRRPVLMTERLILRRLRRRDLPSLYLILCDDEVMYAYNGAFSKREARAWFNKQRVRYRRTGLGLWAVVLRETGEMIGQCGLTRQPAGDREVLEIGYLLARKYWHRGYAVEAAGACRDFAFHTLHAPFVCSIIRDTNTASQKVALRIGMRRESEFVKHDRGIDMLHYLYLMTADDYQRLC